MIQKDNQYEQNAGKGLDYRGVHFPSGLVIGLTLWTTGLLAATGIGIGKEIYANKKAKQPIQTNQLIEQRTDSLEYNIKKIQASKQNFELPDKLAIHNTYQVPQTLENKAGE